MVRASGCSSVCGTIFLVFLGVISVKVFIKDGTICSQTMIRTRQRKYGNEVWIVTEMDIYEMKLNIVEKLEWS